MKMTMPRMVSGGLRMVKALCAVALLCACAAAEAEDGGKIAVKMVPDCDTNAGVGAGWTFTPQIAVPQGKYLRAIFSYELDGKKSEVITVLPPQRKSYEARLGIVSVPNAGPVIYYDFNPRSVPEIAQFRASVNIMDVNVLELFCLRSADVAPDEEIILASTREPSAPQFAERKKIAFPQDAIRELPAIDFHLKFSVTDNKYSFMMERNIYEAIKDLPAAERLESLKAEQRKRMNLYNQGFATLGDINLGQAYLSLVEMELLLQDAGKRGDGEALLKAKAGQEEARKFIERAMR